MEPELEGAEVGGTNVEVDVAVGRAGVALGRAVEVDVGLARGVIACKVCASTVENMSGMEVTEPPQAVVMKKSVAIATVNIVWRLKGFIFLLVIQKPGNQFMRPSGTIVPMLKFWHWRWGFAFLMMVAIFIFSSRPSSGLPDFGTWDYFVKKGAHMLGYGLLALAYWRGWDLAGGKKWFAWGLAVCYAITDEIHQSFVPGRHPSPVDVLLFDNLGAILGLVLWKPIVSLVSRQRR